MFSLQLTPLLFAHCNRFEFMGADLAAPSPASA
jgi:hypothetical protein